MTTNKDSAWVLNATTLVMGGAIQACVNFISEASRDSDVNWHYFVSREIAQQLAISGFTPPASRIHIFEKSPARSPAMRTRIKKSIEELAPEVIFTFFGPAYIKFVFTHFLGFADSWALNPNPFAIAALPNQKERIKSQLLAAYKKYWLRFANYWLVETTNARQDLASILGCELARIAVVPNGCRDVFKHISAAKITPGEETINILCLSSYYPHKRLELVPYVAKTLIGMRPGLRFKFTLTVSNKVPAVAVIERTAKDLGVDNFIDFIGPVDLEDVPKLYTRSHLAFIPTVLEAFSATYSEAMACDMPIITTDLEFAHTVCGDGAYYFSPNDPESAADRITECIENDDKRNKILSAAGEISRILPDANEKYVRYKDFITANLKKAE